MWADGYLDVPRRVLNAAVTALARNPRGLIVAVAVLAPTLGASLAIFRVVDVMAVKRLPYSEPTELFFLRQFSFGSSRPATTIAYLEHRLALGLSEIADGTALWS